MKLRTRILISFGIIIVVPFLLAGILFYSTHFLHEFSGNPQNDTFYQIVINGGAASDMRDIVADFLISMALILVLTALILVSWIYHGLIHRIDSLTSAVKRIQEGDLDFSVQSEGKDELTDLCNAFEDMRSRLQQNAMEKLQSEREQKELISNIAHDLKTPITAVKGYAEGLMDGVASTPEKQEAYLRTIYSKANEMDTLINELSLYSQIDANRIPYHFQHLSVQDYFSRRAEELSMDLAQQGIVLAYTNSVAPGVEMIADPEQMNRVLGNIIGNSVKYMDKTPGEIRICVQDAGDFVQIDITDNGKGIAAKDLPHIFDRMYRADASRNSGTGGSGLGLSIVKKILEDHGGKIWATSREGENTTMSFVLRKYLTGTI